MFEFATASRICFGLGALESLPKLLSSLNVGPRSMVLLVTGRRGRFSSRVQQLVASLGARSVCASVHSEPCVEDAVRLVKLARAAQCVCVIGVGGGSVIDAAKAASALLSNPGDPLDYLEVVGRGLPLVHDPLPFVAIPTTAGTGAESTKNAVLRSEEHGVKVSLRSNAMLPDFAVVDPELMISVPPGITAQTGLDALTQVIEPYVSCLANPMTDALCKEGIARGARSIRRACLVGSDLAARSDMALVSLFGGIALANAKLGAVHGFAGPLGGLFPAPHGAICARLLPEVMRTNMTALDAREPNGPYQQRYRDVACLLTGDPSATVVDGIGWVERLVEELQIPRLADYGVQPEDLSRVVEQSRHSSSMKGNPIELERSELRQILERAL